MASSRLLCPRCGSQNHSRINSRRYKAARYGSHNVVVRANRCCDCGKEWPTAEGSLQALRALLEAVGA